MARALTFDPFALTGTIVKIVPLWFVCGQCYRKLPDEMSTGMIGINLGLPRLYAVPYTCLEPLDAPVYTEGEVE